MSAAPLLILLLVYVRVTTSNEEPCLHGTCTCAEEQLICNPYAIDGGRWVEMHRLPSAIRDFVLPHLTEVDFRYNKIRDVEANAFGGLPNLKTLWLSHNRISFLSQYAFNGLTAVQKIDISFNELETIEEGMFQSETLLESMRVLDLSHNNIRELKRGCFRGLPELRELYLEFNPLGRLDHTSLTHLRMLNTLSLAHTSPRNPSDLLDIFEPLSNLQYTYIDGVLSTCSCEWLTTLLTLKEADVDVVDENSLVAACIEEWRNDPVCDQAAIDAYDVDSRLQEQENRPQHRAFLQRNLTLGDIVAPKIVENSTIVFPDGRGYDMDSIQGKRALYQYDRHMQERIAHVLNDAQRERYKALFSRRMAEFIRANYNITSTVATADTDGHNSHAHGDTDTDEPAPNRNSSRAKGSSKGTSGKSSSKKTSEKHGIRMLGFFLYIILAGAGCGILVVCLAGLRHFDCTDRSVIVTEKEKKEKKKNKCCGWFGEMTGKLSVRKDYLRGASERKHAKQSFVKLHMNVKNNMDNVGTRRQFDLYTTPSGHVIPSKAASANPRQVNGQMETPVASKSGQSTGPSSNGLRRMSLNDGIRSMMSSQGVGTTGGHRTPSTESDYFRHYYSESDDDDVNEETDLFRR
ncbi:uncharacterized protein [Diadema setosum]|uniref:uncharacterized protein isoform X1 n=1 Tax=Diadema setosum TaxID=31175 RepID=UPI003B3B1885